MAIDILHSVKTEEISTAFGLHPCEFVEMLDDLALQLDETGELDEFLEGFWGRVSRGDELLQTRVHELLSRMANAAMGQF